jgi:xylitol oxidase
MVERMIVVDAAGKLRDVPKPFWIHLGLLGVVVELRLRCVPSYRLCQTVSDMPLQTCLTELPELLNCYSLSCWLDLGKSSAKVWARAPKAVQLPGTLRREPLDVSDSTIPISTTFEGVWHDVLPFFPSGVALGTVGTTAQTEFYVPFDQLPCAIEALMPLAKSFPNGMELRFVRADNFALSPTRTELGGPDADTLFAALHFTLPVKSAPSVALAVENALRSLQPKAHWGKLWSVSKESVASQYGDQHAFWRAVLANDPQAKFRNELFDQLAKNLSGPSTELESGVMSQPATKALLREHSRL